MNLEKIKKQLFKNPKVKEAYYKEEIRKLKKQLDKEERYCLNCRVGAVYPHYDWYVAKLLEILSK